MTATRKLLIAVVLLIVGYGVARFVGRPTSPWTASADGAATSAAHIPILAHVQSAKAEATPLVPAGVRLVPDFGTENPYRALDATVRGIASPAPQTALAPPVTQLGLPVAKLRNEVPRPLDLDAQRSAPLQQAPSTPYTVTTPPETTVPPEQAWQLRPVQPAGFTETPTTSASNASYAEPYPSQAAISNAPASAIGPPSVWPEPSKLSGLRTHVVVDGDSLERLANRYLDDPRRGVEIYEANRELLSTPELLPIGAELVIPEPPSRSAMEGFQPQSSLANDPSVRAASHQDMVPVRPIPHVTNMMPRARLLPPVAAE